jgi:hypothetical protein
MFPTHGEAMCKGGKMMDGKLKSPRSKRWRTIAIVLLVALAAAAGWGGYKIYPFVRAAPIAEAEAEAMMASYEKIASEIENRPAADREAFEKLGLQWKERLKAVEDRMTLFDKCPALPEGFSLETEPFLNEFSKLSAAVAGIVDDGFVWKQGFSFDAEIMNFLQARQWAYWEIASAYLDAKSDKLIEAMIRVNRVKNVVATMYETPVLIHMMMGVAIETIMYRGMAAIIPHLNEEELLQMADSFQDQPNITEAFKAAIKMEAVWVSNNLEHFKSASDPNDLSNMTNMEIPKPLRFLMLKFYTKFLLHRERNFYLALVRKTLAMIDSGEISKDPPWTEFNERRYNSLTALVMWPNYSKLFQRAEAVRTRRANFVKALRSEAALSIEDRQTERRYPFDDKSSLTIGPEIGCVKKDATP